MRLLLPIILIAAALGLFILYTNSAYQDIKLQSAKLNQYNVVLDQSSLVRQKRDELLTERNAFSPQQLQQIQKLLPDNIDNIRLIIDINDIAARYHLQVMNVTLDQTTDAIGADSRLGTVGIGFSVSANYSDFLAFLADLERSLRILDIDDISFAAPQKTNGLASYTIHLKTYWLK